MENSDYIEIPEEYINSISDFCCRYIAQYEEKSFKSTENMDIFRINAAMEFIMNSIRKIPAEKCMIKYDWAISLVDAVYFEYPNHEESEPDDIKKLKEFLFKKTGRR